MSKFIYECRECGKESDQPFEFDSSSIPLCSSNCKHFERSFIEGKNPYTGEPESLEVNHVA